MKQPLARSANRGITHAEQFHGDAASVAVEFERIVKQQRERTRTAVVECAKR